MMVKVILKAINNLIKQSEKGEELKRWEKREN